MVLVLLVILLSSTNAFADKILLETGVIVEGTVIKTTDKSITVQTTKGNVVIPKDMLDDGKPKEPKWVPPKADLTLYYLKTCPLCQKMRSFLNRNHVMYDDCDVAEQQCWKEFHRLGGTAVPFMRIGRNRVVQGYYPDTVMVALSKEKE